MEVVKKSEKEKRIRNWVFTLNNYDDEDIEWVKSFDCRYCIYGKEVGDSGTPHLQGFCVFHNGKTFGAVKRLNHKVHWEAANTVAAAIEYCKKDGDFVERGVPPVPQEECGKKGKQFWEEQWKLIVGDRLEELHPSLKTLHWPKVKAAAARERIKRQRMQSTFEANWWYYGSTGTGKSRSAREEYPNAYLKMCNKWWDGYDGEDVVIIEDFDKRHGEALIHHLKIWADHYPFPAEIKGGKIDIRPKKIIVTSNYSPQDIWSDPSSLEPILRRFTIKQFGEDSVLSGDASSFVSPMDKYV